MIELFHSHKKIDQLHMYVRKYVENKHMARCFLAQSLSNLLKLGMTISSIQIKSV